MTDVTIRAADGGGDIPAPVMPSPESAASITTRKQPIPRFPEIPSRRLRTMP